MTTTAEKVTHIYTRALLLCQSEEDDTDVLELARAAWLFAKDTNIGEVSPQMLVAFAEEARDNGMI